MKNFVKCPWMIACILAILLLSGCGTLGGNARPQPGSTFTGSIDLDGEETSGTLSFTIAEDGTGLIDLGISLENVNCRDMIFMGSVTDYLAEPGIKITGTAIDGTLPALGGMVADYAFNPPDPFPTPVPEPSTIGSINGAFSSPTAADGTITIYLGAVMSGGVVCELGTFDWSATVNGQ